MYSAVFKRVKYWTFLVFIFLIIGCRRENVIGLSEAPKQDEALPFVNNSWVIVILPDTQYYSRFRPGLFHLQTQWIVDNKDKLDIRYVLHLGDITDTNSRKEWERASSALGRLDNVVPYVISTGNHDLSKGGYGKDRTTLINDYFPPNRFKDLLTFGGVMENEHIENNYHLFETNEKKWIILGLEWGARDKVLNWANMVLEKYSERTAIIVTHAYLYSDSTRYDWKAKGKKQKWNPHSYATLDGVNDGQQIWDKLVSKHENILMVINGHVLNDGLGYLVSKGVHGNNVHQMLVNFQSPICPLGGESWLRFLEFHPDGETIQVKTYSPLYERYKTDPSNQFVIKATELLKW